MLKVRVRKLANPRPYRKLKAKGFRRKGKTRSNPKRKLTPAQIKAGFGGKRRKVAMKAARKRKRTVRAVKRAVKSNPRRYKRAAVKSKRRTSNPATKKHRRKRRQSNPGGLIVTLGPAMNPRTTTKRRTTKVAKTRKRRTAKNAHRRRRVTKRNPKVIVRYRARKNSKRRNPHARRRHRNPMGGLSGTAKSVFGGLVGVTATKMITGMLPPSITSSPIMRTVASVAVAYGAGLAAKKVAGETFGDAVLFGALMQAGSVAISAFVPQLSGIGLSGMTPSSRFVLPEQALTIAGIPAASPVRFGGAFA